MKRSADFYKVVNAVINTLNQGDSVAYVTGGQGGSGYGVFDTNEDTENIRKDLMKYADCEELDEDELLPDWKDEDRNSSDCEFWQLSNYGDNASFIQIGIYPDNYVTSSYVLRDMICDEQNLEAAEITEGMNGYPRGLRGCVLLSGCGKTIDEMKELAELYGVELVSLHRRDGWQLWESQGWTWDLYDVEDFMQANNDNLHSWDSYKEYAEELREYANGGDMDEDMKQQFLEAAEKADGMELGENEFLFCEEGFPYLTDPDKADRMVDHFSYDTHNYSLALDCMVTD